MPALGVASDILPQEVTISAGQHAGHVSIFLTIRLGSRWIAFVTQVRSATTRIQKDVLLCPYGKHGHVRPRPSIREVQKVMVID